MSANGIGLIDAPHQAERRTRAVALLTASAMVAEIAAGWWFNSMALLADGWHMGTHAAAIGLSALAYGWARRGRDDRRIGNSNAPQSPTTRPRPARTGRLRQ